MSFLKTNAHWLALTATAASSLAATFLLFKDSTEMDERLKKLLPKQLVLKPLPPLDLSAHQTARQLLENPGQWAISYPTPLFVSEPYLLESDGPRRPKEGSLHRHSLHGSPIPNQWFLDHKLPLRTPNVTTEDSDGDGFSNEDEWWWGTNPNEPKDHPPFILRLSFLPQKPTRNRFEFLAYEGNPEKPEAEPPLRVTLNWLDAPNFQISVLDATLVDPSKPNQQTSYKFRIRLEHDTSKPVHELKALEIIPGTSLKVMSWTAGPDGKPSTVLVKNVEGDRNATANLSVGGAPASVALEPKQKRHRLRVGEVIPGTKIKVVRFEPRREKIEGVNATKDKSMVFLREEKAEETRELPAVYNGEKGENIADFVDQTIVFKVGPPNASEPFTVKLGQSIKLDDSETYTLESVLAESALLKRGEGPNKGKKWRVLEGGGRLLDDQNQEVSERPEKPFWNPSSPSVPQ